MASKRRSQSPTSTPSADVLDLTILYDLRENLAPQPNALIDLYRNFLANAATLVHALLQQENETRIRTLHTLKGTAAMLGANRVAMLAARLQEECRRSGAPDVADAESELKTELRTFGRAVADRLDELGYRAEF